MQTKEEKVFHIVLEYGTSLKKSKFVVYKVNKPLSQTIKPLVKMVEHGN